MTREVSPDDFPRLQWRGHWIWVPEEPIELLPDWPGQAAQRPGRESHGFFRKRFRLERVPERVPARMTADSRYVLYVNGTEVSRGPIRSQPRRLYYDFVDLAPYLQTGDNIIAVHVRYYGMPTSYWMPAVPNQTLGRTGVFVFEADLEHAGWLVSDESWRARKIDAWSDEWRWDPDEEGPALGIPMEIIDGRRLPSNWTALDFDDSEWGFAQLVRACHIGGFARSQPPTDPYGPLYPRPIAMLRGDRQLPVQASGSILAGHVDQNVSNPFSRVVRALHLPVVSSIPTVDFPVTVDLSADRIALVRIDMGRIVCGLVQFALEAPAGTVVEIAFTEDPIERARGLGHMRAGARYIARGYADEYKLLDPNGFRFAYVAIHSAHGRVALREFSVLEHLYPWEGEAYFRCNDELLNRIFWAGVRTVQLCSHDAFVDCPTREQRAWVGDGVVHQMVHLATNADWRLAWHYLTLANSPRSDGLLPMSVACDIEVGNGLTIPDWSLHWVHGVYNLYRYTGSRDAVKEFMPTVERILRWYQVFQNDSGVLENVVEWNLIDWSSVSTKGASALITGLWARGLKEFSEMAHWLGEQASESWARRLYERAKVGFEVFWDERRGSYIDHVVDGQPQPEMSQLAGALAIVSGLAPQERWRRIVETITDSQRLVVRSWLGGYGEMSRERWEKQIREGLYVIDWDVTREVVLAEPFMSYVVHDAVAIAGYADRLPDLYARWSQFLVDGYDTIGECWDFGTHVHGWSCTPTRDMIFYTLGVTPAAPGFEVVRVAPRLGRLEWAEGTVPSPRGTVHVEVTRGRVLIESPVPVVFEAPGRPPMQLSAGCHELSW